MQAEPLLGPSLPVGYFVGTGISTLAGIGCLVCLIMVLIPLFKEKGPGLGILGVFCGIFTFVWGWMNVKQHSLKKIMVIWSVCFVVALIGYGISMASVFKMASENPGLIDSTALEAPASY